MSREMTRLPLIVFLVILTGFGGRLHGDDALATLDVGVARGLDFLSTQQNTDGSFGTIQKPAITGLALMAYLASGHTPNAGKSDVSVGKYGANVKGAIEFLLWQAQPDGSFVHNEKAMYGQGIATLALAEAYGVDDSEAQRKRIALALTNSVRFIVAAQDVPKSEPFAGGWRYEASAPDSDLSLSGWNALALRACQDVGIAPPRAVIERALKFVGKCWNPDAKGFAYQPGAGATPAMTGVGLLCLHLLGKGDTPEAAAAAKTLASRPIDDAAPFQYYSHYYVTQAAYQAGDPAWQAVSRVTFDRLLKVQQPDGGWPEAPAESAGAGRAYTTSMALLTLAIPYRLLPVYQR